MLREATDPPAAVNVLDVSSESMAAFGCSLRKPHLCQFAAKPNRVAHQSLQSELVAIKTVPKLIIEIRGHRMNVADFLRGIR